MVAIRQNLVSPDKWNIKCPYPMTPTRIVIHNTANDASANNEIAYMIRNNEYVSFHFAVDDIEAVQGLLLDRNGWHAGDGNGKGNREGIGIEICYSKNGGDRFIKAEQNCAKLVAKLLKERGWGIDKVTKHQDYSGKYCLPIFETDLLTKCGWVKMSDISVGDEIAQYNDGKIEFTNVIDVVQPYESETIKNRVLEATPDHRILYKLQKSPKFDKWTDWETAQSNNSATYIPVGGEYDSDGINLSDDDIRLLVWIQGDGHYMNRENLGHYGIEFHLSKQRKTCRLLALLDDLDIKYSYKTQSDGTSKIRLFGKQFVDMAERYLDNKMFSWKLLEMDSEQKKVFLDELLEVDGCKSANSYCSTKQQNYDIIQAICATSNKRAYQTTTGNSTSLIFNNSRLTVNTRISDSRSVQTKLVGCVSVESGAILIRQNGRSLVVGNCPHRTLDLGWQRFLDMVKFELNPSLPVPNAIKLDEPERYTTNFNGVKLWDLSTNPHYSAVKEFEKGAVLEFYAYIPFNNTKYLVTEYSFSKGIKNGVNIADLTLCKPITEPEPEKPTPNPETPPTPPETDDTEPQPTIEPEPVDEPKPEPTEPDEPKDEFDDVDKIGEEINKEVEKSWLMRILNFIINLIIKAITR